jgi:hypothetical protein
MFHQVPIANTETKQSHAEQSMSGIETKDGKQGE